MRPRQGSRVRHAERSARYGTILRLCEMWDAEAGRWELAAWVAWEDDGSDSPWPLRELVLVWRGGREKDKGEWRCLTCSPVVPTGSRKIGGR